MNVNYHKLCLEEISKLDKSAKILLHSCCAPCSSYVISFLSNYFDITILYYNPNIFPKNEYIKRKEEQLKLIKNLKTKNKLDFLDCDYDNEKFNDLAKGYENAPEGGPRCHKCFTLRLEQTVKLAKEYNYDYFCSTLTVSPHKNSKKINESMRNVTNSLYCEYVSRMLPKIADMVERMKVGNVDYLPDIFEVSSTVLVEIINEYAPGDLPEYFGVLNYSDYFGEKVVGRNAITKIINAWENEKKQFTIDRKKNRLIYTYPEGTNLYELKYICDELPPKLNAKVASRTLVMDLDMACEFFDTKFRKGIF